ncbi:MAG: YicC/YloC family endoribonuclease [Calditrichia bacterium]|nr:YicC family protein [Calditrichota bacterium]MCB0271077.1 YicC family protein [Calditrichota bacterium]MCB0286679.1 YicC family protein [Calditrichota bacterium]MCB9070660.1 YicC family protein [Calditrichia bacterium]
MKPIYSMTGYATEKSALSNGEITCEFRTLNSRYLEIYLKLPQQLRNYEDAFKNVIRKHIDRAKVNCVITISETEVLPDMMQINAPLVKMYRRLLEDLRMSADIKEPLKISDFLQFKDLFNIAENVVDDSLVQVVENLLVQTIKQLNVARSEEGENLRKDMLSRLNNVMQMANEVQTYAAQNSRMEFQKQMERLKNLIDDNKLDRNRLEMEVALISDRVDISEEIVRLNSHIELFKEDLEQGSPIGKKLNFILQEMHREANTMSSKNTLIEISHRVVAIKEEIERMREQVQNIE